MVREEFDRAVCFTFFESYLEQAKMIKNSLGDKACADFLIAICEYALYEKLPEDNTIKMMMIGLTNTIDAGQKKRKNAFKGEDVELSERILECIKNNPDASERKIAEMVGCSKSKVNKTKQKYLNNNNNSNNNSNLNNNNVGVGVDNADFKKKEKKELCELEDKELEDLKNDFIKRVSYSELYKKYSLADYCIDGKLEDRILELQKTRKEEKEKIESELMLNKYNLSKEQAEEILEYFLQSNSIVPNLKILFDEIFEFKPDVKDILKFVRNEDNLEIYRLLESYYSQHRREGHSPYYSYRKDEFINDYMANKDLLNEEIEKALLWFNESGDTIFGLYGFDGTKEYKIS